MESRVLACSALVAVSVLGLNIGDDSGIAVASWADTNPKPILVRCERGETVAKALTLRRGQVPVVIVVKGTCQESVTITRDDVTLRGAREGSSIVGTDLEQDTILIDGAHRVTIENLALRGERNGVVGRLGASFRLRACEVTGNPINGIVVYQGSAATIDNCEIHNNGRRGVEIALGSSATLTNNHIFENGLDGVVADASNVVLLGNTVEKHPRLGIVIFNGGSAHIGFDEFGRKGPNVIRASGSDGIRGSNNASILLHGNTISGNGLTVEGAAGVASYYGNLRLLGDNRISENRIGVVAAQSTLRQGKGDFLITPNHDNIADNNEQGVQAYFQANLDLRDVAIQGNGQEGIQLSEQSTLRVRSEGQGTFINNNGAQGIAVFSDSGVFFGNPPAHVTGNSGSDVQCFGNESSIWPLDPAAVGVILDCTGF
jgi:parallel beta-helix repeat protein